MKHIEWLLQKIQNIRCNANENYLLEELGKATVTCRIWIMESGALNWKSLLTPPNKTLTHGNIMSLVERLYGDLHIYIIPKISLAKTI